MLAALGGGAALPLVPCAARAQAGWPERPIRLVVNAPPGGTADIAARIVSEGLSPVLGRPLVVESKAGGSGVIGLQEMLRAPPDGHTFLVAVNGAMTEVPHSIRFPIDPIRDVRPIVDLFTGSLLLVGHPSVPARTLAELIDWVRRQPAGGVSYASYSAGTASHILGLLLNRSAGITLNHVGYRGSPPAMQDLLGGQVPLMFNSVGNVLPTLRDGRLRAFAIASPARSDHVPEVPTFTELGHPTLLASTWMALWCAPQVPAPIVHRMHAEVATLLGRAEVRQRMREIGFTAAAPRGPDELARVVAAEHANAGEVLRSVGFKPEG